jgi:hypothetical protein
MVAFSSFSLELSYQANTYLREVVALTICKYGLFQNFGGNHSISPFVQKLSSGG